MPTMVCGLHPITRHAVNDRSCGCFEVLTEWRDARTLPRLETIELWYWFRNFSLRGLRELLESGRRTAVGLTEGGAEMAVAGES